MSAFICGPDHFRALACYAVAFESKCNFSRVSVEYIGLAKDQITSYKQALGNGSPQEWIANVLFHENVRSVRHLYPDGDLPGPIDLPDLITIDDPRVTVKNPVHILKMCACLTYQSCETADWEQTPARKLLAAIEQAAIRELPGWDDAPWDYWANEKAA